MSYIRSAEDCEATNTLIFLQPHSLFIVSFFYGSISSERWNIFYLLSVYFFVSIRDPTFLFRKTGYVGRILLLRVLNLKSKYPKRLYPERYLKSSFHYKNSNLGSNCISIEWTKHFYGLKLTIESTSLVFEPLTYNLPVTKIPYPSILVHMGRHMHLIFVD